VSFDVDSLLRKKKSSTPVPFHSASSRQSPNTPKASKPQMRVSKPSPSGKISHKRKRALFETHLDDERHNRLHSASPPSPKRRKSSPKLTTALNKATERAHLRHDYPHQVDSQCMRFDSGLPQQTHAARDTPYSSQHLVDIAARSAPLLTRAKALHLRIQTQEQEEEERFLSIPPQKQVECDVLFRCFREKQGNFQHSMVTLDALEAHLKCTELKRKSRRKNFPFKSPVH